jgi:hypothetical protein
MKYIKLMIAANIACICFSLLTAWFAYLDNGYWGWPFAFAIMTSVGFKSSEDKRKEEREEAIQKAQDIKKYGPNIYRNN